MRRHRVVMVLAAVWCAAPLAAGGAAVAGAGPAAHGVSLAGRWGRAMEVPGLGSLNKGGNAQVLSVSCPSAGNCAAGGFYKDGSGHQQAFVASERNGVWGKAIEVPGSGSLNKGGNAQVGSVSCAAAGDCAAGGLYTASSFPFRQQAFVASERNGVWGKAIEVPGSGSLNAGGFDQVGSVSCGGAGDCAAGGFYRDGVNQTQAFVVSERNGAWRRAIEVPGTAALNAIGDAQVNSVSCPSTGNCAAGGFYNDINSNQQVFVVSQRNGVWGKAIAVPGSAALNASGFAEIFSVSCASAGNCAAGGDYVDHNGHFQAFVASEQNSAWGKAIEVPGTAALNAAGIDQVSSVSCASPGNCAAGGLYRPRFSQTQAFVASERNGTWRRAIEVPGTAALNATGVAVVSSVSCASAGNCAAGGYYSDRSRQAFVVSERNGVWGKAIEVPGSGALNAGGNAQVFSVSCPSAGNCAAGGYYSDRSRHLQAFVVSED